MRLSRPRTQRQFLIAIIAAVSTTLALLSDAAPKAKYWSPNEITYPTPDFQKLDTFEANRLNKADSLFADARFKEAGAAYEAFAVEFPDSAAVAYAITRKGRSLQLEQKRFEAMEIYQEVLDYFPNNVHCAAAALFYFGECHEQNGDEPKAVRAYRLIADDPEYKKHFLAAGALNALATSLWNSDEKEQAAKYLKESAATFRESNPTAAATAIERLLEYYIRWKPDEPALRTLYGQLGTFQKEKRPVKEPVETNSDYWTVLRERIYRHGGFEDSQQKQAKSYYAYWAGAMGDRLPGDDGFRIDQAEFQRRADGDNAKWLARLEQIYNEGPADQYDRTIRWMRVTRSHPAAVESYYRKLNFGKMSNAQIHSAFMTAVKEVGNGSMGTAIFGKLRFGEMEDPARTQIVRDLAQLELRDVKIDLAPLARAAAASFKDKDLGRSELLEFYSRRRLPEPGLELATQLEEVPKHSQQAIWRKGEFLRDLRRYDEAVAAFQLSERRPDSLYEIASCKMKLGKPDEAVAQYREIENFFTDKAPDAALKIAYVFKDTGRKDQFVAQLRAVLSKYPRSSQSSQAHQELERLGVRIGGGVDADG